MSFVRNLDSVERLCYTWGVRVRYVLLAATAFLLAACASAPPAQPPGSSPSSAGDTTPQTGREAERPPSLRVISDPDGATVYLDGRRQGTTPLTVDDVRPGDYLLRVEKSGYYESRQWIRIPNTSSVVIRIELQLITGFLDVTVEPPDATLTVGDERIRDGFIELPAGTHRVHARAFGYEAQTETVRISARSVTRLSMTLERSPFRVSALEAWRPAFSPLSPGTVGTTRISYRVSAPGAGVLIIRDEDGEVVRRVPQGPYTDWSQSYRWDGTDDGGRVVEDGIYTVEITGVGDDGRVESRSTSVTVDRALLVRYRSVWTATPGLLYAPTRTALPGGQVQIAAQLGAAVDTDSGTTSILVPGRLGLRIGLGAGFEAFGYGGLTATDEPYEDRVTVGGSVGWDGPGVPVGEATLGVGLSVGGMHESRRLLAPPERPEMHASPPGFFTAIPVTLRGRAVQIVLAPEYRFVAPDGGGTGWSGLAIVRSGAVADLGQLSAGLSAALYYPVEGATVVPSVSYLGLEAHWVPPQSSVALSAFGGSRLGTTHPPAFLAGLGVGVLF